MEEVHGRIFSGHLDEEKTLQQLKKCFYWPHHSKDVKNWCQTCSTYALRKMPIPKNHVPLQTIKAGFPTQIIALDITGSLPESAQRNSYILVIADYFTHWMQAFAIHNKEAATVAHKLVDEVCCRFGMPEQIQGNSS